MCDFHSIAVRRDGAIAHIAGNSHSGAVAKAGWRENDAMADMRGPYFIEAEWDGEGKFPGVDEITRGTANERQRKVIENHYTALAKLLADPAEHAERMCLGTGIFSAEEYADIRWKIFVHPKCPKRVAAKLAKTYLWIDKMPEHQLPAGLTSIGGYVYLEGYAHQLPAGLTSIGGNVDLRGYAHQLPAGLMSIGGYVYLEGYAHQLPAGLMSIGGYVYLRGYAHQLPAGCAVQGGVIR